uniref:Uncharacterized protein n=1 Tax=Pyramimonas orientalis virus TaxID=455367 RepID=A0A7M3UNZ1_POV01|nr:hypothetical protein HWQ62_00302 [Pyramimonas orientalis virus]
MFEKLNLFYFVMSFCVGILVVYASQPKTQIVYKFPSPTNLNTKYKDNSDNCYKYEYEEVKCSKNAIPQPIIEDFKKNTLG